MSAMLTLDPSSGTYRGPCHRAHSRRLRSLVLIAASTGDRLGEDIRLWHSTDMGDSANVRFAPGADQALSQLLQLPRDKCDLPGQKPAARMSAAKSALGAVKSVPDVATLILAAVGCRRTHRSSP